MFLRSKYMGRFHPEFLTIVSCRKTIQGQRSVKSLVKKNRSFKEKTIVFFLKILPKKAFVQ